MRCILCVLSSMFAMAIVLQVAHGQTDAEMPSVSSEPMTPSATAPSTTNTQTKVRTKVVYKEKSYYDFEDVLINGNVRAPDGSFIFRKSQSNFSSALNLNRSFIPELKESGSSVR